MPVILKWGKAAGWFAAMAAFSAVTFTLGERSKGTGVDENIPPSTSGYVDYSFSKLRQVLPELRGLTADPGHDRLASILNGVGEILADFFRKVPNLICHEHVERKGESEQGEFNYLILVHPTHGRDKILQEYRTDLENKPLGLSNQLSRAPQSEGFATMWVLFFPSVRASCKFRYLGKEQMDKHKTFVLAFAQKPEFVTMQQRIVLHGRSIPVFYQGIAWIDESTFRIVRLRTDLLAPVPSIHLQRQTATLSFDAVRISHLPSIFWLPHRVEITVEIHSEISKEVHLYSDYRAYTVSAKIGEPAP